MKTILFFIVFLAFATTLQAQDSTKIDYDQREKVILEILNTGLNKWYDGNPAAYAEAFNPEITYFDPGTEEKRIVTSQELYDLVKSRETKYDFSGVLDPIFQHSEDVSVLTFKLNQDFKAGVSLNWNATEVYMNTPEGWKIIHAHWSPYSEDIAMLPKSILIGGGIVGLILFLIIGLFVGRKLGLKKSHE